MHEDMQKRQWFCSNEGNCLDEVCKFGMKMFAVNICCVCTFRMMTGIQPYTVRPSMDMLLWLMSCYR